MLERFTDPALRVIVSAQEQSRLLHHHVLAPEHLLLGIVQVDTDRIARTVLGISLAGAREQVAALAPPEPGEPPQYCALTAGAKRAIAVASVASVELRHHDVGVGHLLLGLLRVRDPHVDQVLAASGVDHDGAYQLARDLVAAAPPAAGGTGLRVLARPSQVDTAAGAIFRLVHDRDALTTALRRYGRHENGCLAPIARCTCGFAAVSFADGAPEPD